MKYLGVLLAILLFALSFTDQCRDELPAVEAASILHAAGRDHHEAPEVCSPFCTCSRCAFSVLIPKAPAGNLVAGKDTATHHLFPDGMPVNITLPIWQPPQAG